MGTITGTTRQDKVGDQVELKSGGPTMTVREIDLDFQGKVRGYRCQWFSGKKLEGGHFPHDSLKSVPDAK